MAGNTAVRGPIQRDPGQREVLRENLVHLAGEIDILSAKVQNTTQEVDRVTTNEMIDGLGRLAEIMEKAEFRDWSAWCKHAAEELMQRREVVAIVHTNYVDGMSVSAFWDKSLAKKTLEARLDDCLEMLEDQGYTPEAVAREDGLVIYAADGNIYYEWQIDSVAVTEETERDDLEITSQYKEYLQRRGGLDSFLIKLLIQTRDAVSQGASGISGELLEEIDRYINRFSMDARCPRCGRRLFLSDLPQYAYVCYDCDENFFDIETAQKGGTVMNEMNEIDEMRVQDE